MGSCCQPRTDLTSKSQLSRDSSWKVMHFKKSREKAKTETFTF